MRPTDRDISVMKHMYEYCEEIDRTLKEIDCRREKYDASSTHRNALALCIMQIGELSGLLSDSFKASNTQQPWRDIKQMRNIIAHHYGAFDYDILWEVVTEGIPELKAFCREKLNLKL